MTIDGPSTRSDRPVTSGSASTLADIATDRHLLQIICPVCGSAWAGAEEGALHRLPSQLRRRRPVRRAQRRRSLPVSRRASSDPYPQRHLARAPHLSGPRAAAPGRMNPHGDSPELAAGAPIIGLVRAKPSSGGASRQLGHDVGEDRGGAPVRRPGVVPRCVLALAESGRWVAVAAMSKVCTIARAIWATRWETARGSGPGLARATPRHPAVRSCS